jgi:hypothetical protein
MMTFVHYLLKPKLVEFYPDAFVPGLVEAFLASNGKNKRKQSWNTNQLSSTAVVKKCEDPAESNKITPTSGCYFFW